MSGCRPEAIEAYVLGELDEGEAASVAAHLSGCSACAEELRWLRLERRLFADRAEDHPAPPPFEAILARALAAPPAGVAEATPARPIEPIPAAVRARAARAKTARRDRGGARARGARQSWAPGGGAIAAVLAVAIVLLALPREEAPPLTPEPRAAFSEAPRSDPPPAPAEAASEDCQECGEASCACAPEGAVGCIENSCVTCGSHRP